MLQFQRVPAIFAAFQHPSPDKQPNHPRRNGFVEHVVGVVKMLMDKAGKERNSWISGLLDDTPNSEHCITFATQDTAQVQRDTPPTHAQCTTYAPGSPGAHQEARK